MLSFCCSILIDIFEPSEMEFGDDGTKRASGQRPRKRKAPASRHSLANRKAKIAKVSSTGLGSSSHGYSIFTTYFLKICIECHS